MELREKIERAILEAMDVTDGLDAIAAERYADAILALPEIKEALARPRLCDHIMMVLGGERDNMSQQDVAAVQRFASKIALHQTTIA